MFGLKCDSEFSAWQNKSKGISLWNNSELKKYRDVPGEQKSDSFFGMKML